MSYAIGDGPLASSGSSVESEIFVSEMGCPLVLFTGQILARAVIFLELRGIGKPCAPQPPIRFFLDIH